MGYTEEIIIEDEEVKKNPIAKAANGVADTEKVVAKGLEKVSDSLVQ